MKNAFVEMESSGKYCREGEREGAEAEIEL
jgi:hypothetical protein